MCASEIQEAVNVHFVIIVLSFLFSSPGITFLPLTVQQSSNCLYKENANYPLCTDVSDLNVRGTHTEAS